MARLPLQIVLCEGRLGDAAGVKLLLASAARHAPGVEVVAYLSGELFVMARDFERLNPHARAIEYKGPENWSCKPAVLLRAMAETPGERRWLWVDVDILIAGDLSPLTLVPADVALIAEESNPNSNGRVIPRQQALGMTVGRPHATTLSSCVIGVTRAHEHLVREWQQLMALPAFLNEQAKPPAHRKLFFGDQEVWEAVLCAGDHADVALKLLRNGREMLQATYTHHAVPLPPRQRGEHAMFVHATGNLKPWRQSERRLTQEMFPYFWLARPYFDALSPTERLAFKRRSGAAWAWQHLLGGFTSYQWLRQTLNRRKRRNTKR